MENTNAVLRVEEAARLLRVSPQTVYAACRAGTLPTVRVGRVLRLPRAAIERLLRGEKG